jgi:hypothetical protein
LIPERAQACDVLVRAVVVWLLLLVLAILNGAFREAVLNPALGPQMGPRVSTVLLSGLMALTLAFRVRRRVLAVPQATGGAVYDYNLTRGRIWPVVLVVTALSPVLVGKWRHLWP